MNAGYLAGSPLSLSRRWCAAPRITRYLDDELWSCVKQSYDVCLENAETASPLLPNSVAVQLPPHLGGLRVSEVCANNTAVSLARRDWDGEERWLLEIIGKGAARLGSSRDGGADNGSSLALLSARVRPSVNSVARGPYAAGLADREVPQAVDASRVAFDPQRRFQASFGLKASLPEAMSSRAAPINWRKLQHTGYVTPLDQGWQMALWDFATSGTISAMNR